MLLKKQFFVNNRQRFKEKMLPNSAALIFSNDEMPRNGDQHFPYRQSSDFYYLTGIGQEKSVLLLYPDSPNPAYREVLFLIETNETIAVWNGHKYSKHEAQAISGISDIQWLNGLDSIINEVMFSVENLYVHLPEQPRFISEVPSKAHRYTEKLKTLYPLHQYKRANPILKNLRMIKSKDEIDLIKKACNLTGRAFEKILKVLKPGMMEFEIEAEITYEFNRNGFRNHAYYPIVASGRNACILHYIDNNKKCKSGELLLLDFGVEMNCYASDLSRTIPVNGKFSKRQKECYNAVLRVFKNAVSFMKQGNTIAGYHQEVCKMMEEEMIYLKLFSKTDVQKQNPESPLFRKYFMHGTSHHIGMDVHDCGSRHDVLSPGMVLSCEPGLYIPEESIGIRIENDILITDNKPVDLMEHIPIEVNDIEKLMLKK